MYLKLLKIFFCYYLAIKRKKGGGSKWGGCGYEWLSSSGFHLLGDLAGLALLHPVYVFLTWPQ
jgi:hypothetical protein